MKWQGGCWIRAERLLFRGLLCADPQQSLQDGFRNPICWMDENGDSGLQASLKCEPLPSQASLGWLDKDQHPFMGKRDSAQLHASGPSLCPCLFLLCIIPSEKPTSDARKYLTRSLTQLISWIHWVTLVGPLSPSVFCTLLFTERRSCRSLLASIFSDPA